MRSECRWVYQCEYPSVYRGEPARGCAALRCNMCRVATCAALQHVPRYKMCCAATRWAHAQLCGGLSHADPHSRRLGTTRSA
jgi:hypothetical protein